MILEIVVAIVASGILGEIFDGVYRFMTRHKKPENEISNGPSTKFAPSDFDQELIEKSKAILRKQFPQGAVNTLQNLSPEERVERMKKLAAEIAVCYDIDISLLEFLTTEQLKERGQSPNTGGYYCDSDQRVVINADLLYCNDLTMLREAVYTMFHECRHAFQHKAVAQAGFGGVDPQRVEQWKVNFVHYISPDLDPYGYYYQDVEFDARNFGASVLAD